MKTSASIIFFGRTERSRAQQTSSRILAFLHLPGAAQQPLIQRLRRRQLQQLAETSSTPGKELSVSRSWQRTPPVEQTSISPPETHSRRSFMCSARLDVSA